jgi:hypothetical protein
MTENQPEPNLLEELKAQLHELRAELKAKKKLSLPEEENALSLLKKSLEYGNEGFDLFLTVFLDMPVEPVTQALIGQWGHLDESQRNRFVQEMGRSKDTTPAEKRIRFLLIDGLIGKDPENAIKLLRKFVYFVRNSKQKKATPTDLKLLRETLLDRSNPSILSLNLEGKDPKLVTSIAELILSAVFEPSKGKKPDEVGSQLIQLQVLRWIPEIEQLSELINRLAKDINGAVRGWENEFQQLLAREWGSLHQTVRQVLEKRMTQHFDAGVPAPPPESAPSAVLPAKEEAHPPTVLQEYDPFTLLDQLSGFIRDLKEQKDALGKECHQWKEKYEKTQESLFEAKRESEQLRRESWDTQNTIQQLRDSNKRFKEQAASLAQEKSSIGSQLRKAEEEKHRLAEQHHKNTAELTSRIGKEGTHQLDEFRNRLAGLLKTDYQDFISATNIPMSDGLGENFRSQIDQIFKLFQREGIHVEGRLG